MAFMVAVGFRRTVRSVADSRPAAVEFQRGLRVCILRGRLFSEKEFLVAAGPGFARNRHRTEFLLSAQIPKRQRLESVQSRESGVQLWCLCCFDFSWAAVQTAVFVHFATGRRNLGRNFILSHHEHGLVVLQSVP